MTSPVIDLVSVPDSPTVHRTLPTTTAATATTTTTTILTTIPLPPQPQQVSSDSNLTQLLENQDIPNQVSKDVDEIVMGAVDWAMHAPLRERFRDMPEADMKEILHNRIDQILSDLAEARKKKKKRQGSPKTPPVSPPHPPLPTGPSGTSGASGTFSSSKTAALAEYTAWTMTDNRLKVSVSPIPEELHMDDDTIADKQAYSSSGKDAGRDYIPIINLRQSWWKPLTEDKPATPEPAW
ncbi:hypothetical protein Tco_1573252, partial [Tanacetum coccineum]